jgi:hypothetical protein
MVLFTSAGSISFDGVKAAISDPDLLAWHVHCALREPIFMPDGGRRMPAMIFRRPERRNQVSAEWHSRHEILCRNQALVERREWHVQQKTQWHNVVAFGQSFARMAIAS